jgi:hypothetical protein
MVFLTQLQLPSLLIPPSCPGTTLLFLGQYETSTLVEFSCVVKVVDGLYYIMPTPKLRDYPFPSGSRRSDGPVDYNYQAIFPFGNRNIN